MVHVGAGAVSNALSSDDGYWPYTSSVDFCEPNYAYSRFVAEMANTLTSLVVVCVGIIGLRRSWPLRHSHPRHLVFYTILFLCGWGSVAFHATLTWQGQAADELTMLWSAHTGMYSLITPGEGNAAVAVAIASASLYLTRLYMGDGGTAQFALFIGSYIVTVTCIIVLAWRRSRAAPTGSPTPLLLALAAGSYVAGFLFLWIPTEILMCDSVVGLHGHALFHLTSAFGSCTFGMLNVAFSLESQSRKRRDLRWLGGVLPYVV